MPLAPPPQRSVVSSSRSIFGERPCRAGRRRRERRRRGRSGWSRGRAPSPARRGSSSRRKSTRSSSSRRLEQPFGVAAALEPDQRRERRVGGQLAAHLRHGREGAHFVALASQMPSARPAAHLVMSPAPMQMTMSPSAARSRSSRQSSSRSATVRTMRWPWARKPFDQGGGIDALDRLLAGGIDRRHEHHVGVVEGVLEVFHQRLQPGVAMRLHDRDDAAFGAFARGGEHRADFGRVVGVIVDDRSRRRPRRPW